MVRRCQKLISAIAVALVGASLLRNISFDTEAGWQYIRRLDPSVSIQFYIKTSGVYRYVRRVKRTADTWAKDADGKITLITDGANAKAVDTYVNHRPYLSLVRVPGADRDGGAHQSPKTHEEKMELWRTLRLKMRAVFEDFSSLQPSPDWICYLDDDMMVNVKNLKAELKRLQPRCKPNCLIADGLRFLGTTPYTAEGWCMERDLASRVHYLLSLNTDEELKWLSEDDIPFNAMLKRELNVTRVNSPRWYSRLSKPSVTKGSVKKVSLFDHGYETIQMPTWKDNRVFMKSWLPTLSVFNIDYAYPAKNAVKSEKKK